MLFLNSFSQKFCNENVFLCPVFIKLPNSEVMEINKNIPINCDIPVDLNMSIHT